VACGIEAFAKLYRPHKAWEETVAFPAYRAMVPKPEQAATGRKMERMEEERFGPEGFLGLIRQVEALEQAAGIQGLEAAA